MESDKIKLFKCKTCGKQVTGKDKGRFINMAISLNDKCAKCEMETRKDLDRTGRSSKKDKFTNKDIREDFF